MTKLMSRLLVLLFMEQSLCDLKNIAREGTAEQIDSYQVWSTKFLASRAIDGISNGLDAPAWDFSRTATAGKAAWWLLTLPRIIVIREIKVYNRVKPEYAHKIEGVTVWVGVGMTGGDYEEAVKVGTIQYVAGTNIYILANLEEEGSSVQIQGGSEVLQLAEVKVYREIDVCPVGYSLEVGDIKGWGTAELGSMLVIGLREECANRCDALPLCLSFEHSNTAKLCNLNKIAMPSKSQNYEDYAFCRKTTECTPGNYMDSETEQCKECPPGTFNAKMGRKAECSECEAGKFSAAGSSSCSKIGRDSKNLVNEIRYKSTN
ncbi:uncharacterized protein LOC134811957 [Bolinopsis microptera]|uniref:uncharacterized protein LOC134811957 n=1 Tax=Bolinopsis microptera TaxID=2820187 RepID=UPI00307AFBD8